ncbi:hypothetical protein RFI_26232 [Reticulomyxa filosa]|uniref:Uncharacterized protein n=1 Tax=Reticulomyxa filosa TaxID=46433 RepID=X6MBA4_RETFI|nr:hypothetical protein RFI_26232 [Reticulomyxa filosa]|eukprot:ETO11144.1 hypothetical protein RFI_26232 [Reticulomyxa filosa]
MSESHLLLNILPNTNVNITNKSSSQSKLNAVNDVQDFRMKDATTFSNNGRCPSMDLSSAGKKMRLSNVTNFMHSQNQQDSKKEEGKGINDDTWKQLKSSTLILFSGNAKQLVSKIKVLMCILKKKNYYLPHSSSILTFLKSSILKEIAVGSVKILRHLLSFEGDFKVK